MMQETFPHTMRSVSYMLYFAMAAALLDGAAKYLTEFYPALQITFARYFIPFIVIIFWLSVTGKTSQLNVIDKGLQIVRGCVLTFATLCYFAALVYLPIAETLSLAFISPLIVTALSPVLLKEQVGVRRWIAVLVGFIGILIILRPGLSDQYFAMSLAICSGVAYAFYIIITRRISTNTSPIMTLAWTSFVGTIILSPFVIKSFTPIASEHLLLYLFVGASATIAHFFLIKAYQIAMASVLAPWMYSEMIFAICVGYIFFSYIPDSMTIIGIVVICFSGLYISIREHIIKKRFK